MTAQDPIGPRIGAAFNPAFIDGGLSLPDCVSYVEVGPDNERLQSFKELVEHSELNFSLHLSRAPFGETELIQDQFVDWLSRWNETEVESIGLHLCGPYDSGMGKLGLGSSFVVDQSAKTRAHRLLEKLTEKISVPLLLENANFYDPHVHAAREVFRFLGELVDAHDAKIILDITHLYINARNCGVDPRILLSNMAFDKVAVIHVSGYTAGADGRLHDGHSKQVADPIWELAREIIPLCPLNPALVLEHSDPSWKGDSRSFTQDFARLADLASAAEPGRPIAENPIDQTKAAISYLANIILPARFPVLYEELGADRFPALVRIWAADFLREDRTALASVRQVELEYLPDAVSIENHFANYIRQA